MSKQIRRYRGANAQALLRQIEDDNLIGATLVTSRSLPSTNQDEEEILELTVQCDESLSRLEYLRKRWQTERSLPQQISELLQKHEVSPSTLQYLVNRVSAVESGIPTDSDLFIHAISKLLTRSLRMDPRSTRPRSNEVSVLIGPPSSGKSTVAAAFINKGCAIIHDEPAKTDGFDLDLYAKDLGAAIKGLRQSSDLRQALLSTAPTGGAVLDSNRLWRSPHGALISICDDERLEAAWRLRYHLVLDAASLDENDEELEEFFRCPISSVIVTGLDRANTYGPLLDFLVNRGISLSYIGTGAQPGTDLEPASGELLARWLTVKWAEMDGETTK